MKKAQRKGSGEFIGTVKTEWILDHPRNMRLLETIRFCDSKGVPWFAFEDTIIDGASTGWFLRRLFPAFVGRYRRATVLHDCYCTDRDIPSWRVHRMFREAMLADGTLPVIAWAMWLAVRVFGPRF